MTFWRLSLLLTFVMVWNIEQGFSQAPTASINSVSSTTVSGFTNSNFEIFLNGSYPLSVSIDGKVYSDINLTIWNVPVPINKSKYYVIDSVWNSGGKIIKADSVFINFRQRGSIAKETIRLVGDSNDEPVSFFPTSDDGKIIAFNATSKVRDFLSYISFANSVSVIQKRNSTNQIEWEKVYESTPYLLKLDRIIPSSDGGVLGVGFKNVTKNGVTAADAFVFKLNSAGVEQWSRAIGGTYWDYGFDIVEYPGGGAVICGRSESNDGDVFGNHGGTDSFVAKLSSTGSLEWTKLYGGSGWEAYYALAIDSQGKIFVGGDTFSSDGNLTTNYGYADIFISKLNADGSAIWHKNFGGNSTDYLKPMALLNNDSLYVSLYTGSSDLTPLKTSNSLENLIIKIDGSGNLFDVDLFTINSTSIYSRLMAFDENEDINIAYDGNLNGQSSVGVYRMSKDGDYISNTIRANPTNENYIVKDLNTEGNKINLSYYSYNLSSNPYFNNVSDFVTFENCIQSDLTFNGSETIAKYDTIDVGFQFSQVTYPAWLYFEGGGGFYLTAENQTFKDSPLVDKTYKLEFGYDACGHIPINPNHSYTLNVTPCPATRNLGQVFISNRTYQATETVEMNGESSNILTLEAGRAVELQPGFKTQNGTVFKAEIKDCVE